jgi:hypothetical protein
MMKTLADLKRAMAIGTEWHCFNHIYNGDMGTRSIVRKKTNSVAFKTVRRDGKEVESWVHFPKASDMNFPDESTAEIYEDGKLILTYRKI